MVVTYQNLTIRNAEEGDAALLCSWWNDGTIMAHAGFPNGLGTNQVQVAKQLASNTDDRGRTLIIEVDHIPIGEMSYHNLGNAVAEIGIKICDTTKQEKGHGSLFLKMLMTALFANQYEKIILDTNLLNTRAQHVYQKLGFTKLRINQDAWTDQLGVNQSSIDYEMLKENFLPLTL